MVAAAAREVERGEGLGSSPLLLLLLLLMVLRVEESGA